MTIDYWRGIAERYEAQLAESREELATERRRRGEDLTDARHQALLDAVNEILLKVKHSCSCGFSPCSHDDVRTRCLREIALLDAASNPKTEGSPT